MLQEIRIDALLPQEMALRAEYIGVRKAETPALKVSTLSVMAGSLMGLGAVAATTISVGSIAVSDPSGQLVYSTSLPYGLARLLTGLVFSLGLILVVVGGAELFTGNNLIVMAWASKKVSTLAMQRKWVIVYLGNFVGSFGTAVLVFLSKQYTAGSGGLGEAALKTVVSQVNLGFVQALAPIVL